MPHPQYQTLNLRELLPDNSFRLTWVLATGMRDGLNGALKGREIRFGEIKFPKNYENYFNFRADYLAHDTARQSLNH